MSLKVILLTAIILNFGSQIAMATACDSSLNALAHNVEILKSEMPENAKTLEKIVVRFADTSGKSTFQTLHFGEKAPLRAVLNDGSVAIGLRDSITLWKRNGDHFEIKKQLDMPGSDWKTMDISPSGNFLAAGFEYRTKPRGIALSTGFAILSLRDGVHAPVIWTPRLAHDATAVGTVIVRDNGVVRVYVKPSNMFRFTPDSTDFISAD
jgi:hypothetical protein